MIRFVGFNWRAVALAAGLLLTTAPYPASGQVGPADSQSNIACVERLEMPDYPALPLAARIQGVQTVTVSLSQEATVQIGESSFESRSTGVERYFKESAEKALRISGFSHRQGNLWVTDMVEWYREGRLA